jgi:predicted metal-dependent peptidase
MYRPFSTFVHKALKGVDPVDYTPQQRIIASEWVARQSVKDNQARVASFRKHWTHAKGRERLSLIASMAIQANGVRAISYPKTLALPKRSGGMRLNPTPKTPKRAKKTKAGPVVPVEPVSPSKHQTLLDKAKQARVRLLFNHPFFGFMVSSTVDVIDDKFSTAATDGKNIYWGSKFLDSLSVDDAEFVMGHEVMHCVLQHLWRKGKRNHKAMNVAADVACNDMLVEGGLKEPKLNFPIIRGSNVIELWTGGKVRSGMSMTGKSMEEIYDELVKLQEEGKAGGIGSESEKNESGNSGGTLDDHGEWKDAEDKPGGEGASDYWKAQAANARNFGKISGGIARHLEEVLYPKADWRVLLKQGLYFPIDYSWAHMDRRLMAGGIYVPSLHGEKHRVVFALDTSGSMSGEMLSEFWAEISYIARQEDIEIRIIAADAEIQNEWREGEFSPDLIKQVRGGGGTDFRPVFKRVAEYAEYGWNAEIVVYLTDMDGQFPSEAPDQRVIWGVMKRDENKTYPFGDMIVVE